jgi:hypothetical protein
MSKSSEYVKKWRKKVKEVIVGCMGGKCQICGYDRCDKALELHHINPEEKDFSFGFILASCRSWELIYSEISKCILLCSNCHREVHDGMTLIPETYSKFDVEKADSLRSSTSLSAEQGSRAKKKQQDKKRQYSRIKRDKQNKKLNNIKLKYTSIKRKHAAIDRERSSRIKLIEDSGVDFTTFGWAIKISKIINISPQKVTPWMKTHMKEFYETKCFRRKSPVKEQNIPL